jgi:hypothetical protein
MNSKEGKLLERARSRMAQATSADAGRYMIFATSTDGENGVCVISRLERLRIGVQAAIAQLLGADAATFQPPDEFLAVLTDGIAVAKKLHGANGAVQRFIPRYGINIGIVWEEGAIEDFLALAGAEKIEHRLVI